MQFEPSDHVSTNHLGDLLIEQLAAVLKDKNSFARTPMADRDGLVPNLGIRPRMKICSDIKVSL